MDVKAPRATQNCPFARHETRKICTSRRQSQVNCLYAKDTWCSSHAAIRSASPLTEWTIMLHEPHKCLFASQCSRHTRRTNFATRADVKSDLDFLYSKNIAQALNMQCDMPWHDVIELLLFKICFDCPKRTSAYWTSDGMMYNAYSQSKIKLNILLPAETTDMSSHDKDTLSYIEYLRVSASQNEEKNHDEWKYYTRRSACERNHHYQLHLVWRFVKSF